MSNLTYRGDINIKNRDGELLFRGATLFASKTNSVYLLLKCHLRGYGLITWYPKNKNLSSPRDERFIFRGATLVKLLVIRLPKISLNKVQAIL